MAGLHADRQTNMQMNQPVWFVEDRKLMSNEEGKKKLQEVADANSKSQQRLTIVHGSDFDKASRACLHPISCCGNALAKGRFQAGLLCIMVISLHDTTSRKRHNSSTQTPCTLLTDLSQSLFLELFLAKAHPVWVLHQMCPAQLCDNCIHPAAA